MFPKGLLKTFNKLLEIKGVGGGKDLISPFFFIFTYVIELSFLVSKSAHLSPNSRRFRFYRHLKVSRRSEKWPKNRAKIQCFDQDFEKNALHSNKAIKIFLPNTEIQAGKLEALKSDSNNLHFKFFLENGVTFKYFL